MSDTRRVAPARAPAQRTAVRGRAQRTSIPFYQHPAIPSLLVLLACLAFVAAAVQGVFTVQQVRVVGVNLPAQQLVAAANVQGKNIFRVRADDVIAQLQSVRQVVVTRVDTEFPGTVIVHARLRQRFLAWQRGKQLLIVDPDGRIIDTVPHTSLPVVVGPAQGEALGPGVVQAVRYAQSTLPSAPFGRIARYEFGPIHGLTIVGQSGWRAIVGRGTPAILDMRIATLAGYLRTQNTGTRSFKTVDLRPREPYVTHGSTP